MIINSPKKNGVQYFADNTIYLRADDTTVARYMNERYPSYVLDSYVIESRQRFSNDGQLYHAYYEGGEWKYEFSFSKVVTSLKILVTTDVASGSTVVVTEDTQFNYLGETGTTATVVIDGVSFIISNSGSNFIWDLGGLGEYNFGSGTTGSINVTVNGKLYTINFTRGSLLFSIVEVGNSPDYFTLPDEVIFSYPSGTTSFLINTNLPWSLSESISWLTFDQNYGTGKTTVSGTVTGNTDNIARTGLTYVTVDSGSIHEMKSILMTQIAEPDYITVNKTGLTYSYSSGLTDTFVITTNLDWVLSENIDWIQFNTYNGTGTTTVTGTIVSGNTGEERSGLTTITTSLGSVSLLIIQSAVPPPPPQISIGTQHSLVINSLGQAWGWGYNTRGSLGDNSTINRSTPVAVCGNHTFTTIAAGNNYSLSIDNLGQAWGWGFNTNGQLGDNTFGVGTSKSTPVAVCGNHTFIKISAGSDNSFGINNLGQAWGWGYNVLGQLGDGTIVNKSTPVAVCGNHTFTAIAAGSSHSIAIDNLGQAWGWGGNYAGRLGDGTIVNKSTPVAVCGNHTFTTIAAGSLHSIAIDNLGQAWGWGINSSGQLGDGTIVNKSTPVAVCGNHTFIMISSNYNTSLAIDNLGQAWAWGNNSYGQLGDNTSGNGTSKSIPVAVCGNHTFISVSIKEYSLAVDNLGQTWGWGRNTYGQLGDNTTVSKRTPVRVCNL